jgi:hypothetical protein
MGATEVPNMVYASRYCQDQQLFSDLISLMIEKVIQVVVSVTSSEEVRDFLRKNFLIHKGADGANLGGP